MNIVEKLQHEADAASAICECGHHLQLTINFSRGGEDDSITVTFEFDQDISSTPFNNLLPEIFPRVGMLLRALNLKADNGIFEISPEPFLTEEEFDGDAS